MVFNFNIREGFAEVIAVLLVIILLTYISVVIGELVPKTFAFRRPIFLASKAVPWLYFISRIIDPIVSAFEWSTKEIVNFFPKNQFKKKKFIMKLSSGHNTKLWAKNLERSVILKDLIARSGSDAQD